MKFKVLKGSETFEKLEELKQRIIDVNNQAAELVKTLGGQRYCKKGWRLAGGISAIEFETKPEGYKQVGESYQSLYYPKVGNKKDCKLIEELPTVDYKDLNDIVGFKGMQTVSSKRGLSIVNTIGLIFCKEIMLIDVEDGCKYEPPTDIIEILNSEYLTLKEIHESTEV